MFWIFYKIKSRLQRNKLSCIIKIMDDKKQKPVSFAKLVQGYDEDFKLCDFSPEELNALLNRKKQTANQKFKDEYFSYYNDVKSSSLKKQDW